MLALFMRSAISTAVFQPVPTEYKLVWNDEFEVAGVADSRYWAYEEGFVRNEELQWYQAENAFCQQGKLIIEARRENRDNPNFQAGSRNWKLNREKIEYTSACITTRNRLSWKYGIFEIRARIKTQNGLWPAIWFLGQSGEWPSCGEIDLMEYYQGNILANACWGQVERWQPRWDTSKHSVASFNQADWDDYFHVWRMEWNAQKIVLSMDGKVLNTINLNQTNNLSDRGPKNPFHQPHYLLLNLAVGGKNGGEPDQTPFPSRYEIDYVRVYQKKN